MTCPRSHSQQMSESLSKAQAAHSLSHSPLLPLGGRVTGSQDSHPGVNYPSAGGISPGGFLRGRLLQFLLSKGLEIWWGRWIHERQCGWDPSQNALQRFPYTVLFLDSWEIWAERQSRGCLFQHPHFRDEATEDQER